MTNGLLGKKLGMTQVFDESRLTPVTVIEAGPCRVVTVKTKERDGYEAVQLSFGEVKERKLSKAELGHLKKHQAPASRVLREFKKDGDVDRRADGEGRHVQEGRLGRCDRRVQGQRIPRGRQAASLCGWSGVAWVHVSSRARFDRRQFVSLSRLEGKTLPGHMGAERVTVQRLKVIESRPDENLLFVRGAVPGAANGLIIVRKSKKG